MTTPTENVVAELRAKADAFARCYDRTMLVHELLVAIDQAATLIETQRATIERVERERDEQAQLVINEMIYEARCDAEVRAAEARVTALEAEKAGLVEAASEVLKHRVGDLAKRTGYLRDNDHSREALEALDYRVARASLSSTEKTDV